MTLPYEAAALADRLLHDHVVVAHLEARHLGVGAAPGSAPTRDRSTTRLGWLDVAETMAPHLDRVRDARTRRDARSRLEAVYLLGMGGSSLCAEVLRSVFGVADGLPAARRPRHHRRAHAHHGRGRASIPARTWFVVASKSGGTVEVASMERFFWAG